MILNTWWEDEELSKEALEAIVVLIYKKGDTNLCQNYRPISLQNAFYKLLAAAIQRRLAESIEHLLQKTQDGFRQKRGASEAVYNVRRVIPAGESTKRNTFLLLLDWAKVFGKITHKGLMNAVERMAVAPTNINLIKFMYQCATLHVAIDGIKSNTYTHIHKKPESDKVVLYHRIYS